MFSFTRRVPFLMATLVIAAGCAQVKISEKMKGSPPQVALAETCEAGSQVKNAKGSAWLKVKSKDASGQFPAQLEVVAPTALKEKSLRLEAHNPLGGTEAVISVLGDVFTVEIPNHKERTQKGTGSWGGIPLEWATDLFLGKIPCPAPSSLKDARLSWGADGDLVAQTAPSLKSESQKFIYSLKWINQKPWAEKLHWERIGFAPLTVDFKFNEPEDVTRSPLRWEAKSALGEIKVHWKDRVHEEAR